MEKNNENVAIVVSSCDLYSDCWNPLFCSLNKNLIHCSLPIYLICNEKNELFDGVEDIRVGEHLGWGSNTKKALNQISAEYVLLIQEDYFLNKELTTDVLLSHVDYCREHCIDYLRLGEPFRDVYPTDNPRYCKDPVGLKYSLCLQPAIWKKETLQRFTIDGWTGWDYERNINKYIVEQNININSAVINSSYSTKYGYNMVKGTGIRKGIWTQGGLRFLKENGFEEEIKGRGHEGKFLSAMMDVEDGSFLKLPARIIVRIIQKSKGLI